MIPEGLTDAAWEAEFRRLGMDRQFNSDIAHRRLYIALANLWRTIMEPLNLSVGLFIIGLMLMFAPSFFYGDWNGMAALLGLSMAFIVSAVWVARMADV